MDADYQLDILFCTKDTENNYISERPASERVPIEMQTMRFFFTRSLTVKATECVQTETLTAEEIASVSQVFLAAFRFCCYQSIFISLNSGTCSHRGRWTAITCLRAGTSIGFWAGGDKKHWGGGKGKTHVHTFWPRLTSRRKLVNATK